MQRIPVRADVVVMGGGPAGSTAANLLAQKGFEVVLLDRVKHPRSTVGESVLPHVWKYLDELGATEDVERANFIKKSGGTAIWQGVARQMAMADFGFTRPSLHVERDEFDEILLRVAERKGAQVFEEVTVRKVHLDDGLRGVDYGDRRTGEEGRIHCQYIVDASGQSAIIANQLGFREFDNDLRFMGIWGYYDNSAYIAQGGIICPWEKRREIRPTTVQLGVGDWGWCWHIVQKEHTSVGLVLPPSKAAEFKASADNLEARFDNGCRVDPIMEELLRDAKLVQGSVRGIRDFAYRPTQLAGDGWYLAGDAAAFVDPINSAGVVTAFYTGFSTAWAVGASMGKSEKRAYFSSVFSTLVRQRLALFRISALPVGHNSHPEDIPLALQAARLDRESEQELLLVQTVLTDRSENLAPLYAMDSRLKYGPSRKYRIVPELSWLGAEMQVAG